MRTVEFHYFSKMIIDNKRLQKQYIETLRDTETLISLGHKDYIENKRSDEEILNYYETLPTGDFFYAAYDKREADFVGTCRLMRYLEEEKSIEVGYMVFLNKRRTGYGKAI